MKLTLIDIIEEISKKLDKKREELENEGEKVSDENWQCLKNICNDRAISEEIYISFEKCSSDWKKLVSRLIKEISYIRDHRNNQTYQYLIQGGKISVLKKIDISKEAVLLFGDGIEKIYQYQPNKEIKQMSKVNQNCLAQLLREKGISMGAAIANCSFEQGELIAQLAKELQEMKQGYQDEISLFYCVIQNGKVSNLSDFDKKHQALFLISEKFQEEIYVYQP